TIDPAIARVPVAPHCESSRHLFQILTPRRDEVMAAMNAHRVYPGMHYRDNTLYRMYAHAAGTCPRAAAASARVISLPLHVRLTEDDVARVSAILGDAVR